MATAKDIARLAGVSTATVSNVLNRKPGAAGPAKTREILELAQSLHYQPNAFAKNLKKQKTDSIGVITEDLTVFNTPEIVDGIESFCEENGYEIILSNLRLYKKYKNDFADTPEHRELFDKAVRGMTAKQVEGIIYIGCHCRRIDYKPALLSIPFVYAYCFSNDPLYASVMSDDEDAAYRMTEYLISKGHTRIGVAAGPETGRNTRLRLQGCQKALEHHGLTYEKDIILYGSWEQESGYQHADRFLEAGVTAVFAFNDMMASGIYRRFYEKGVIPGRDIALTGFDNLEMCNGLMPALSSVAPPLGAIGRKSAELVLGQIKTHRVHPQNKGGAVLLPCELVIRDSVNQCPQAQK